MPVAGFPARASTGGHPLDTLMATLRVSEQRTQLSLGQTPELQKREDGTGVRFQATGLVVMRTSNQQLTQSPTRTLGLDFFHSASPANPGPFRPPSSLLVPGECFRSCHIRC